MLPLGLANLHFHKPTRADVDASLTRAESRVNHAALAGPLTLPSLPPSAGGFAVDRYAVRVGESEEDFRLAAGAVAAWKHAQQGWVEVSGPGGGRPLSRPSPGDAVCIAARALGPLLPWAPWLANPLVVVGVREKKKGGGGWKRAAGVPQVKEGASSPALSRYDVALATTAGHVLAGGERFSVERRPEGGGVWFEASAFARPASVAAVAGWPVVRALQAAFRRGAGERVRRVVEESRGKGGVRRRALMW